MANKLAQQFKALHKPSSPIVLPNVWDVASFNTVASLNTESSKPVKALATASWAIAATYGVQDEELTLEQNLEAISKIAPLAKAAGIPLSADLQDGYGSQIESTVKRAVELGVIGANIEDRTLEGTFYTVAEQVQRLKSALKAASGAGCPDFVVNARCDIFFAATLPEADELNEAITRGKAYLEAGATTVFYWGGSKRGLRTAWVETLVRELKGRVSVKLAHGKEDALSTRDLADIGVARISVGPSLFLLAQEAAKQAAERILSGGNL
ncbi:phosphoenolpyruvate phosphomutase-domain-containing protein [Fusarium acuminatum]|uniref:Phosphoenolpyruvate phosphomutase-domain-containing protein n=1 Tax=Fusarium acuminatum TaxID=5515 RepID=A0ABZ2WZY7_9HYPO